MNKQRPDANSKTTSDRKNISQPAEWWAAFAAQAERDGQSLSEWLGDCGLANLDPDLLDGLPDRPTVGKRAKPKPD